MICWDGLEPTGPVSCRACCADCWGETAQARRVGFPAGTGVTAAGWDGIAQCDSGNQFAPEGLSVWEVSAQQRAANAKARRDYDKRVEDIPADEHAEMVYVAVVCAAWTGAEAFARAMSQRGEFRWVQALNVDEIEAWLECAPVTTVWLRERMGRPVPGSDCAPHGGRTGWRRLVCRSAATSCSRDAKNKLKACESCAGVVGVW